MICDLSWMQSSTEARTQDTIWGLTKSQHQDVSGKLRAFYHYDTMGQRFLVILWIPRSWILIANFEAHFWTFLALDLRTYASVRELTTGKHFVYGNLNIRRRNWCRQIVYAKNEKERCKYRSRWNTECNREILWICTIEQHKLLLSSDSLYWESFLKKMLMVHSIKIFGDVEIWNISLFAQIQILINLMKYQEELACAGFTSHETMLCNMDVLEMR